MSVQSRYYFLLMVKDAPRICQVTGRRPYYKMPPLALTLAEAKTKSDESRPPMNTAENWRAGVEAGHPRIGTRMTSR